MFINKLKRIANRRREEKEYNSRLTLCTEKNAFFSIDTLVNEHTHLDDWASVASGDIRDTVFGRGSYARHNTNMPNCQIGNYCSIASNCSVIVGVHPLDRVSTYPGFYDCEQIFIEHFSRLIPPTPKKVEPEGRFVVIGNDVWIGSDVSIMPGVRIGDGAVIGAKALVTKDVPAYAIVGGVPAKVIRFRFEEDERSFLLSIEWWLWKASSIKKYANSFESPHKLRAHLEHDAHEFGKTLINYVKEDLT